MPERIRIQCGAVRVKRIDAVVFRGDENDVVDAARGHGEVLHVKRLRLNLAIHGITEHFAERTGVYVRRGQDGFLQILTSMLVVILTSQNIHSSSRPF
jgi:hypothetical protein